MTYGALNNQVTDFNFLSSSFRAVIHRLRPMEYDCTDFTSPNLSLSSVDKNSFFTPIPLTGISFQKSKFSFRFKVNQKMENYIRIMNWMKGIGLAEDFEYANNEFFSDREIPRESGNFYSDISVFPLTRKFNPNMEFKFTDCFPSDLSSLSFSTTVDGYEELTASVDFLFSTMKIVSLPEETEKSVPILNTEKY